jgi:MFS family permease
LLITVTGNLAAALLWAFSGTFAWLLISRVFSGMAGGNIATATAAVADVTPGKERARGMGLVGAAFGMGFILTGHRWLPFSFRSLITWGYSRRIRICIHLF